MPDRPILHLRYDKGAATPEDHLRVLTRALERAKAERRMREEAEC